MSELSSNAKFYCLHCSCFLSVLLRDLLFYSNFFHGILVSIFENHSYFCLIFFSLIYSFDE